ncbi:hypothetical protein [Stackebrandtia albiflava]|uniref:hypothetical protein n=1 Tax=Stackebrandtia albiflava TaxID=406432 RepID=UPI0013152A6A|nr:hypothetical protein [Stackebrandtia albiflava]
MNLSPPPPQNPGPPGYPGGAYPPPPPPEPGGGPLPGPGMPPPVDLAATGPKPTGRPVTAILTGLVMGGLALFFIIAAIMEFAEMVPTGVPYDSIQNIRGAYFALMGVVALVAAVLVIVNGDFGRVFAASVAGAAMWEAAEWWQYILLILFDGNTGDPSEDWWIRAVPPLLGGFSGIVALIMLAMPKFSDWSSDRRRPRT